MVRFGLGTRRGSDFASDILCAVFFSVVICLAGRHRGNRYIRYNAVPNTYIYIKPLLPRFIYRHRIIIYTRRTNSNRLLPPAV